MMWRSKPAAWPGTDLLPLLVHVTEGFHVEAAQDWQKFNVDRGGLSASRSWC
jgi:hypothetical protein